jgi:hypothetical protein
MPNFQYLAVKILLPNWCDKIVVYILRYIYSSEDLDINESVWQWAQTEGIPEFK